MSLESFGGQFIIVSFKSDECLKPTKTGKEESMALMIGASKSGALIASRLFPKQRSYKYIVSTAHSSLTSPISHVMTSTDMHRYA